MSAERAVSKVTLVTVAIADHHRRLPVSKFHMRVNCYFKNYLV